MKFRTDMFDYQDQLHHMSSNRTAPPEEMADIREDYAVVLICNLRLHIERTLGPLDGKALIY